MGVGEWEAVPGTAQMLMPEPAWGEWGAWGKGEQDIYPQDIYPQARCLLPHCRFRNFSPSMSSLHSPFPSPCPPKVHCITQTGEAQGQEEAGCR